MQARLLAFHAAQTAFFAKPAAKNRRDFGVFAAAQRRRPRLQVLLNYVSNKQRPSGWMVFVYMVAGARVQWYTKPDIKPSAVENNYFVD